MFKRHYSIKCDQCGQEELLLSSRETSESFAKEIGWKIVRRLNKTFCSEICQIDYEHFGLSGND